MATLRMQQDGTADFALWKFTFASESDLLLDVETRQGKEQTRGTVMLVSGQAMLTKGLSLEAGYEIDALDGPVLMYQLLVGLLSQAAPEGPAKLQSSRKVNFAESKRAIQVATQSASGRFPPPWALTGVLDRRGPEDFVYSLTFIYSAENGAEKVKMELAGHWVRQPIPPVLNDSMNIEDWSLHTIGPFSIGQKGTRILDYGAQPKPFEVHTLGELRKALAQEQESR